MGAQGVKYDEYLVEGVVVEGAEAFVDEEGVERLSAGFGGHDVRQAQGQGQAAMNEAERGQTRRAPDDRPARRRAVRQACLRSLPRPALTLDVGRTRWWPGRPVGTDTAPPATGERPTPAAVPAGSRGSGAQPRYSKVP
jgi:hypothetical protein